MGLHFYTRHFIVVISMDKERIEQRFTMIFTYRVNWLSSVILG